MDYFFNNQFDKKDIQDTFLNILHEKLKEYIQSGILSNCTYYKYEIEKCPKEQIKINTNLINNFNEKFLLNILKINNNLKIYYDIKYNIIHSLLLKQYNKNKVIFNKNGHNIIKNLYKIKKKCTSYFINEFLIIKCIHNTQFGNIYYCKNIFNNKKYCMKLFYLIPCLKYNCPYYINDQVFMTNYFYKILNEIFFLIYLKNKNIVHIEKIFWDNKKKIICIFLQYIKYQSMYFKKKVGFYSIYKKENNKKIYILEKNNKNKFLQIQLYSENFIKELFLHIYKTLISLLKKNVAYHDLKPDNILLNKKILHEIITCTVQVKNKRKIKNTKQKEITKKSNIEIVDVEYNIQKNLTNISKKRARNDNNNDIINLYNKNIFGRRKKEEDKENEQKLKKKKNTKVHFYPYYKIDLESIKKNKIKYIYNVKLNKCLEYDGNFKTIFFMKNNLRNICFFSSYDSTVHIQMFVKKNKNISHQNSDQNKLDEQKSNYNNDKKNEVQHMYNIQREYITTHNMHNNYQINKIRNMSIFKCTPKKYIRFLKFYWIYLNKEDLKKQNVDSFLIYLDLYFINKYLNKKFNSNNILGLKQYQNQKVKKHHSQIQIESKIEHDINKKLYNNNNNENEFNMNKDFFKLIDFDTCSFISQNCNHPGTNIFSPYEALFNVTNKDINYYKKLSYNFGSVLYTFVYGKSPYYGKDIFEIFQNMQKRLKFPKYRKINKDLRNLLRKLLKKNQDERIQFKKIIRHKWFINK